MKSLLSTILFVILSVVSLSSIAIIEVDAHRLGQQQNNHHDHDHNNNNNNNNKDNTIVIPVPAIKIGSETAATAATTAGSRRIEKEDDDDDEEERRSLRNVVHNVLHELETVLGGSLPIISTTIATSIIPPVRRSLGGGPTRSSSSSFGRPDPHHRSLYQEWARDNNGAILWWIWLIIALCITGCVCSCCCFSVCCLKD